MYWLLPGKEIADGLRVIVSDSDTNVMASVVDRVKNLVVYFDHDDSTTGFDWDDIVANPVADLPKVISPTNLKYVPKTVGENLPTFYTDMGNSKHQHNSRAHGSNTREEELEAVQQSDGGGRLKKDGISSEDAKRMVADSQQADNQRADEPLNAISHHVVDEDLSGSQLLPHLTNTQLSQMMQEEPQPSMLSLPQGPLPDPDFIMSNRPIARPAVLTTSTKQGKAAAASKKRKAAKNIGGASSKKNLMQD